ncbi:hypothetical protein QSV34_10575 [Porticoccus sp. W117]|uniref:hypothetical protein n=1 Tax=Porticoccus sp. W117 TaxID=3054777 RepID=UPI0025938C58|nr:hypothetical protein [Porticoccus sp. W117]MDM3871795.1 hypothetical protein [Porticoccus sp. W117]
MRRLFKNVVFGLLMIIVAVPAMAGKDFIKKDMREKTTEFVQAVGARLSEDKLTFVVHGGNKKMMMAAYRVAQRLDDEGIPVAFLLSPDRDNIDITMYVDYWAKGSSKYWVAAYDNDKNTIEETEQGLYDQAVAAYEHGFGKKSDSSEEN